MKILRRVGIGVAAVLLIYLALFAGFALAMRQPFDRFAMLMARTGPAPFILFPFEAMWKSARAGQLQSGEMAPDFKLPLLDGSGSVQLSSLRGVSPVVLVFGSYT